VSDYSVFQIYSKPKTSSFKVFEKKPLTTLIAGGIINPFGPTLTAIVIPGKLTKGEEKIITSVVLNPFSQQVKEIGKVEFRKKWRPLNDLTPFYLKEFLCCPTLLIASDLFGETESVKLFSRFLQSFDDGYQVLEKVRKYPCNPWDRVESDMKDMESIIRSSLQNRSSSKGTNKRQLSENESNELASELLKPAVVLEELKAFEYAWNGSIDFQGGNSNKLNPMPWKDFVKFFFSLTDSTVLPSYFDSPKKYGLTL